MGSPPPGSNGPYEEANHFLASEQDTIEKQLLQSQIDELKNGQLELSKRLELFKKMLDGNDEQSIV